MNNATVQLYHVLLENYLINFQCTIAFTTTTVRLSQKRLLARIIRLWAVSTLFLCRRLTLSSLKNRIIKSEDVLPGHNVQLFENEDCESAMNDSDAFTVLSDTFPGFREDQPIAITYESGSRNGED